MKGILSLGLCIIVFCNLSLFHLNTEKYSREVTPQPSFLFEAYCEIDIKFLGAEGRYNTLSKVIKWSTPT